MTQQYLGQIPDPAQESGLDLAARLNAFDNAHRTNQSGATRPAGILAGATWTRVVGGVYDLMVFDGAQDRIVMRVDGNLAGLPNLEAARLNLGLKALATKDKAAIVGDTTGTLSVARGGTGGTTQAAARDGIGISVGSGGLNRLNESVNHVDSSWVAGASDLPGIASPKQIADAIGAQALGVGQEWVNVRPGRVIGTAYQNTTGRPLQVMVQIRTLTGSGIHQLEVSKDNIEWQGTDSINHVAIIAYGPVIPAGSYYRITSGNAASTIMSWWELR